MKTRWLWLVMGIFLGCTAQSALADDPVMMVVTPLMVHQFASGVVPLKVKFKNLGEVASGSIQTGDRDKRVVVPITLAAKETRSLIVYCPLIEKPGTRGEKDSNSVVISFETRSKSGSSSSETKLNLGSDFGEILLISSDRNGLGYLTGRDTSLDSHKSKGLSVKVKPVDQATFDQAAVDGRNVSSVGIKEPLDRVDGLVGFRSIFLGKGSGELSDPEVRALKQYLVKGGQIVIGTDAGSALTDPRWTTFLGRGCETTEVGLGRVINLGFNCESQSYDPNLRLRVNVRLIRHLRVHPPMPDLHQDQIDLGARGGGPNPFQVKLPGFGQIATLLGAYFFLCIPINYLVLKRLQRPELMWITAPLLAMGFASIIFKSADRLYSAPTSVAADGSVIWQEGVSDSIYSGAFGIFTPTAGTVDLNFERGTFIFEPYYDYQRFSSQIPPPLPTIVDDGTLNVREYHTSNLQFREFNIDQVLKLPPPVKFSVRKSKDGVWLLEAKNLTQATLKDVHLFAGEYSAAKLSFAPGDTILLPVDEITGLPEHYLKSSDIAGSSPNPPQFLANQSANLTLQVQGRIGLVANYYNLPVGPRLRGPVNFRSRVTLYCFASPSLKIP